jgi:hypothetical protein
METGPLLLADFNNWISREILLLGDRTTQELLQQGYQPEQGLRIRVYEPDYDGDDLPDYLFAEGSLEKHADRWALRGTFGHVSGTPSDHWARQTDWDAEDRRRGLKKRLPGQTGLWGSGHKDPTLSQCVDRLVELLPVWARQRKRQLPSWTKVLITEEVNGTKGDSHDVGSFTERFEWIRRNAARSWVNLHAAGISGGVLQCVVEYRTDGNIRDYAERYVNLSGPTEAWWKSLPEARGE